MLSTTTTQDANLCNITKTCNSTVVVINNGTIITNPLYLNNLTLQIGGNVSVNNLYLNGSNTIDLNDAHLNTSGLTINGTTTIVFDGKSTINVENCLVLNQNVNIQLNLSDSQKKGTYTIITYKCFQGDGKLNLEGAGCSNNGISETLKNETGSITVTFGTCVPTWGIILIGCICGAIVVFVIVVFVTPLKDVIFPFLKDSKQRKEQLKKEEEEKKRKTHLDTVEYKLNDLKGEIDRVKEDRDRIAKLVEDIDDEEDSY